MSIMGAAAGLPGPGADWAQTDPNRVDFIRNKPDVEAVKALAQEGKTLAEKQDRTADEDAMLDLLVHGGSRVSEENLAAVMEWYRQAV